MTPEEKEKLLVAFCGYLPYKLQIQTTCAKDSIHTLICAYFDDESNDYEYMDNCGISWDAGEFKPYLRPMSSMTEEEKQEMHRLLSPTGTATYQNTGIATPVSHFGDFIPYEYMARVLKWLNAHHFDYHGLIEMGLALEAQEGMYNTKTKKKYD